MKKKITKQKVVKPDVLPIISELILQFDLLLADKTNTLTRMATMLGTNDVNGSMINAMVQDAKTFALVRDDFRSYFKEFF